MATIRNRGPYQWQAIIKRKGIDSTSKTFETRRDAEAWAKITEADMIRGHYIKRDDAEKTTLAQLVARYRQDVLPTKRGKHFGPALKVLDESLGKYALSAISSKRVAAFRDARMKSGLSGSTVRKEINLLSSLIDLAGKEWGITLPSNPCAMVSRPRENNARERRLNEGEERCLLESANAPTALLVRLALESAARLGELLSLRWADVDLRRRVMLLRGVEHETGQRTKNEEAFRAVPLSTAAVAVLTELKALPLGIDGRVFYWWKASDSFNKTWTRVCRRAEIEDLRFHDLRHEATSRLFERGVFDSMEVASITGHKTLAMLKRYVHLRAEDLARKLA